MVVEKSENQVSEGYKQTDVGVIPEDWNVKPLGDVADIRSGGTPSSSIKEFWNNEVLWATPTDITKLKGVRFCCDFIVTI